MDIPFIEKSIQKNKQYCACACHAGNMCEGCDCETYIRQYASKISRQQQRKQLEELIDRNIKTFDKNPPDVDMVNNPPHYNNSKAKCPLCAHRIECITITRHMNFNIGNAIKYLWRFSDKNGIEDLKKARWYLDDYIRMVEGEAKNES